MYAVTQITCSPQNCGGSQTLQGKHRFWEIALDFLIGNSRDLISHTDQTVPNWDDWGYLGILPIFLIHKTNREKRERVIPLGRVHRDQTRLPGVLPAWQDRLQH